MYNFRFSGKIYIAVPWQSVAALLTHIFLLKAGAAKNILHFNRCLYSMQFVFDIFFLRFSLCALFCVTLWQPAVFYSVLVPYLRTHITLKPTYVKDRKLYRWNYYCFGNQFVPCHFILVQLTMKRNTFEKELF